jgi:hypothetical protein
MLVCAHTVRTPTDHLHTVCAATRPPCGLVERYKRSSCGQPCPGVPGSPRSRWPPRSAVSRISRFETTAWIAPASAKPRISAQRISQPIPNAKEGASTRACAGRSSEPIALVVGVEHGMSIAARDQRAAALRPGCPRTAGLRGLRPSLRERPERTSGRLVSAYPKTKASRIDATIVAPFVQPKAVPSTSPSTSPMAQPVRQWTVALSASRLSDSLSCSSCAVCITASW